MKRRVNAFVNKNKWVHPDIVMLIITLILGFASYYLFDFKNLDLLGSTSYRERLINCLLPLILLGDIISFFKDTFRQNLAEIFYYGMTNSLADSFGTYFLLKFVFSFPVFQYAGYTYLNFRKELPNRTLMIMAFLLNFNDESSFKTVMTAKKSRKYASRLRGRALINLILISVLGFSLSDFRSLESMDLNLLTDSKIIFFVITSTLIASSFAGILSSLTFKVFDSLRSSTILQILYFVFTAYLACLLGFLNGPRDYVSEELLIIFYGLFTNNYLKYNFSRQAAGKLKYSHV